ncbi:hypothetical protein [Flavobacterium sp.]|uniref:hypothetical protein n=1 Tax=Flavobacterium sp. TaxID=239 RepID=UPI0026260D49|nr:hypothetical protein [Flavobacterium sp.]
MGFFDKIKSMVGVTGVKLEYTRVESPWPYFDPMIKATISVKAGKDAVTIIGTKGTFYAKRTVNGTEEKIVLGTDISNPENCASTQRNGVFVDEFPCALEAEGEVSFTFFINDMDVPAALAEWGGETPASAKANGITFFLEGEVDVKETLDLFDPTLTQEVEVYHNEIKQQPEYQEEDNFSDSIYNTVIALEEDDDDDEITFTPEQRKLILSDDYEIEYSLDGMEVLALYSLGQMHGKVVRLKDIIFDNPRVGLFKIEHINGHRNLDFSNPDLWRSITVDSISITFSKPNEWGHDASKFTSLFHIKNIALLKQ